MHRRSAVFATLCLAVTAGGAGAQTDYFNTDAGRPLRIEDAHPIERRAIELQLAPVMVERVGPGEYVGEVEPHIAVGIARRTHLAIGAPIAFAEGAGRPARARTGGIEVSLFHNLNAETSIPALAIEGSAHLPVGDNALKHPLFSLKGIASRSFTGGRVHLNARYTFGDDDVIDPSHPEPQLAPHVNRWMAGLAIDRPIPLKSILLGMEIVATQPMHAADALEWTIGGGWRIQLSPRIVIDGGGGRRVTGERLGWYVTTGSAFAIGIPWWPR